MIAIARLVVPILVNGPSGRFVPMAMPSGPREADRPMGNVVPNDRGALVMIRRPRPRRWPMNAVTTRKPAA